MSIGDEREVRQRLGAALDTITPSPAPVAATLRKGRAVRARRRIGVAAGLAIAVGIGLAVPLLVHQVVRQAPLSHGRQTATLNPVAAVAPHGVIGSGRIDGHRWQLLAQKPGADGMPRNQRCFLAAGAAGNAQGCGQAGPFTGGPGDPVGFATLGNSRGQIQYGLVAPQVTRLVVTLGNGTALVVYPTEAYGQRYAAFAIPLPLAISRVVAYAGQAELRHAVPFNSASGAIIATWLRPAQPGLPRSAHRIGSGRADGQAWSETVHVGPWGYCFTGIIGGCFDTVSRSLGNRVGALTGLGPAKTNWVVGTGTAAVDHVRVTLSGGSSLKVAAVDAGGPRFFAFAIPQGARLVRVDYYTASGSLVAREPASQIG
jgi:hypothetical protein